MMANELANDTEDNICTKLDELWEMMKACVVRGCEKEGGLPGVLKLECRALGSYRKLKDRHITINDSLVVLDRVPLYALAVNEENAAGLTSVMDGTPY